MENEITSDFQQYFLESEMDPSTLNVEIIMNDETNDGMSTTTASTFSDINNESLGKYFILYLFMGALIGIICCLFIVAGFCLLKKLNSRKRKLSTHFVDEVDCATNVFHTKQGPGIFTGAFKLPLLHPSNVPIPVLNPNVFMNNMVKKSSAIEMNDSAYMQNFHVNMVVEGTNDKLSVSESVDDLGDDMDVIDVGMVTIGNGTTDGIISDDSETESSITVDCTTNRATTVGRTKCAD